MTENSEFLNWLQQIPSFDRMEFCSLDDEYLVVCPDDKSADQLWQEIDRNAYPPLIRQKHVVIRVGEHLFAATKNALQWSQDTTITEDAMQSQALYLSPWAREHPLVFNALEGCAIIYSTDRDQGYRCLAAKYEFDEEQFNRPLPQLIGQPLNVWAEAIALPRQRAIEQFLETGEEQRISYENYYQGAKWLLHNRIFKLSDDEIVVTVTEGASWQRGYWENYAKSR